MPNLHVLTGAGESPAYPVVRKIVREAQPNDYRWSAIILGIVKSKPFQMIQTRGA